jgi:succinate-semialdehyde dehydrogenase/glutarate-semialdehyde dehydrogenase
MTDQSTPAWRESVVLDVIPSGFLADEWRAAAGGRTFAVSNPATEEVITQVADCGRKDALAALDAAHAAADRWAVTSPPDRASVLHRLADLLLDEREPLARLLSLEVGTAVTDARGEVRYAASCLRRYAEQRVSPRVGSAVRPHEQSHVVTVPAPVGPWLLITPGTAPLATAAGRVAQAWAAGCTAVLKPAKLTPLSALLFAELAREAGAPPGVLTVVTSSDPISVTMPLLADPRLRHLSFTGSTSVGRQLMETSGRQSVSASMELRGNAPFLVFDDADLELAVRETMTAKVRMGGQSCVAANRFLVQDGIADQFVAAIAERMAAIRVGSPLRDDVDLGPLVDRRAVEEVRRLVDDARAKGAVVVVEGRAPEGPGHYVAPTVLDHVPSTAAIMREVVPGPVAAIRRFSIEAEAVALANDSDRQCAASVLTSDPDRTRRIAGRLQGGMVGVNRAPVTDGSAPFDGFELSAVGREGRPGGVYQHGLGGVHQHQELKDLSLTRFGT